MLFPSCVHRTSAGTKNEYNGIKITSDASFLRIVFDLILLLQDWVQDGSRYIIALLFSRISISDIKCYILLLLLLSSWACFLQQVNHHQTFHYFSFEFKWVADNHKHNKGNMEGHKYHNQMIQPIQSTKRKRKALKM